MKRIIILVVLSFSVVILLNCNPSSSSKKELADYLESHDYVIEKGYVYGVKFLNDDEMDDELDD